MRKITLAAFFLAVIGCLMVLGALPASAASPTVTYDWFCEADFCRFDSSGSDLQDLASFEWNFGDGSFLSTGSTTVFHDYNTNYGEYYFDVTLTALYYSSNPVQITCTIHILKQQVGGVPGTSGTCSN